MFWARITCEHQGVDPKLSPRMPRGLGDEINDIRRDSGHEPHGAVLDDEAERRDRELPALPPIEIKQGAQRVLTGEPVFQRRKAVTGPRGHIAPQLTKCGQKAREGNAQAGSAGKTRAGGLPAGANPPSVNDSRGQPAICRLPAIILPRLRKPSFSLSSNHP